MIEAGIAAMVASDATVKALLGVRSGTDTGVYPVLLPMDAQLPAVTYQVVGSRPSPTLDTSGFQRFRIQFDCWGQSYGDAVKLRAALIKLLNGYQGVLSDETLLQNAEYLQAIDDFDHELLQYRAVVEFYLYFTFS